MSVLQTRDLSISFGGLKAISNLNVDIEDNHIHGIIGPNGSGKSTFFNLVSGVYKADSGSILYKGKDLVKLAPHQIAALGVSRTFQLSRIWSEMTVLENLMVGHHCHIKRTFFGVLFNTPARKREEARVSKEMLELLDFVGMADFAGMPASEVSGGQSRLIILARAMAMRPDLLLLDEPGAGLSPTNVDNILNLIRRMQKEFGITIIVVEHILKVIMDICIKVSVLDYGEKIAEGTPEAIKKDTKVIEAYLGQEMDDEEIRRMFDN